MTSTILLRKSVFLLTALFLTMGFYSCTSTLYLAPKQVECTAVSDQKCYLIRRSTEENWILHYDEISGLEYEPGFSYKIKVKTVKIKNPPADGSTMKYDLVEVLEKKDVTDDIAMEDLLDKEWKLEFLKSNNTQIGIEKSIPTLRFGTDAKISGNGGCNNFFGTFKLDGRGLKVGDLGSTRMMCEENMELEDAYLKVLALELRALFSEGKLILSGDDGNQMIFSY
jgi:heat shock protein HslJ